MFLFSVLVLVLLSALMITSCSRAPRVSASNNGVAVTRNETAKAPAAKTKSVNEQIVEDLEREVGYHGVFIHTDNCGVNDHYTEMTYREMGGVTNIKNMLCENFAIVFHSDEYRPSSILALVFIPVINNNLMYNDRKDFKLNDFFTVTDYKTPDGKMYYILKPRDINKFEKYSAGAYALQPFAPGGEWSLLYPPFAVIH